MLTYTATFSIKSTGWHDEFVVLHMATVLLVRDTMRTLWMFYMKTSEKDVPYSPLIRKYFAKKQYYYDVQAFFVALFMYINLNLLYLD